MSFATRAAKKVYSFCCVQILFSFIYLLYSVYGIVLLHLVGCSYCVFRDSWENPEYGLQYDWSWPGISSLVTFSPTWRHTSLSVLQICLWLLIDELFFLMVPRLHALQLTTRLAISAHRFSVELSQWKRYFYSNIFLELPVLELIFVFLLLW